MLDDQKLNIGCKRVIILINSKSSITLLGIKPTDNQTSIF